MSVAMKRMGQTIETGVSRWALWRRVGLIAFLILGTATATWAMPWLPLASPGLRYNERLLVENLLALLAAIAAFIAVFSGEQVKRKGYAETMSVKIHSELVDMRRRSAFLDRIGEACGREGHGEEPFGLIILSLVPDPPGFRLRADPPHPLRG